MDGHIGLQLLLQLFLILLNAIFACAEIAVISINDARLEKLASTNDVRAVRLKKLTDQPARFLATIQVAITLSGFFGASLAAENFAQRITAWATALNLGLNASVIHAASLVIVTFIVSYVTLVFGELVPKRLAMRNSEKLALAMSGLITAIAGLFRPLVYLLTASTNGILRLLGVDPDDEEAHVTEEEIRMMVDMGNLKGTIDHDEKTFIQNVFEFDDMTAEEIATHRTEVAILYMDDTPEEWDALIRERRHTLFPVCGETPDDIIGILDTRDYFRLTDFSRESVMSIVKEAYFVPASVRADVLFRNMKRESKAFAIVLDEFGGMEGVVTINDLVEELVGDLESDELDIEKLSEGRWRAAGSASLDDITLATGVAFPEDEYETLGGLIYSRLDSIPEDGTKFELEIDGLIIMVTDVRDHRVVSADIEKKIEAAEGELALE
ncbi:MAG: hemolysin family protein [Christensenellales bacterium]|jgi:putative hemolysin